MGAENTMRSPSGDQLVPHLGRSRRAGSPARSSGFDTSTMTSTGTAKAQRGHSAGHWWIPRTRRVDVQECPSADLLRC